MAAVHESCAAHSADISPRNAIRMSGIRYARQADVSNVSRRTFRVSLGTSLAGKQFWDGSGTLYALLTRGFIGGLVMFSLPALSIQSARTAVRLCGLVCVVALGLAVSLHAQTVTVTNVFNNGYNYNAFPGDCSSGYNIPSSNIATGNHLEREHVIYNATTDQWVMWAHYDNSNYTLAEAMVLTSTNECGPYTAVLEFQPDGEQIRDDYVFEDTDGSAYFIAASNKDGGANDTMAIFKLTSDYTNVDPSVPVTWVFEGDYREAPVVVKNNGTYFLLTSQAAGWYPSQGGYATSTSMLSGWSALQNLGNSSTFGGQESDVLTIKGTQATSYVMTLDHLSGHNDSGSMWLPLTLDGSTQTATLNWYSSWSIDKTTGLLTLPDTPNLASAGTASADSSLSTNPPQLAADGNYASEWVSAATGCGGNSCFPALWTVDLGSPKPVQEIDISWYMVKGSEGYYTYNIDYSNDGSTWTTIDHIGNKLYGFTFDPVSFTARYVRIDLESAVLQNNPNNNWYTPQLWEVAVLGTPASTSPGGGYLPVTVTATPSSATITTKQSLTEAVVVSGGSGNPTPTGTVTLTGGGYTSPATALIGGSVTFNVAAGALDVALDILTATYVPDTTSSPIYGTSFVSATASIRVNTPVKTITLINSGNSNGNNLLPPGTSGSIPYTITVTPSGGFSGQVNLTCNVSYQGTLGVGPSPGRPLTCGLGSGTTASVTIAAYTPATATLTVSLPTTTSQAIRPSKGLVIGGGGLALAGLLLFGIPVRRRGFRALLVIVIVATALGVITGCGNSATMRTAPGLYYVTVSGADAATGSITGSTTLNIVVE